MNKIALAVLAAGALIACGASMLADSTQDATLYPGYPTQGKVWIQNRGQNEAIPVTIEGNVQGPPMRVVIAGSPPVTLSAGSALDARRARQSWDYREITISGSQSLAAELNSAGSEGWETTGLSMPGANGGTVLVLKRPR
ncbi:MAG TPA: hypothetical protein VNZ26_13945 [Vicinamibacterales bacterium]|jgi:hypothetical protein|nr:hypothetical protein [Vicinamibacterales bacterium]